MSEQPFTDHFGLTRVGQGESVTKNGNAALDLDRITIDDLIWALAQHSHTGTDALADPTGPPTLTSAGSGGSLPPDTTYYYRVSYLDKWGLETAASDEATITTGTSIDPPVGPSLLTDSSGGTLAPGLYTYGITALTDDGGETTLSPPSSVRIPAGTVTNRVYLTFPPLPAGAVAFNVYRSRPGQSSLYYLMEATNGDPIYDVGSNEDATVRPPRFNTTNESNTVTVTLPGAVLPDGATSWRVYRSEDPGVYDGQNLVHTVVEGATETSTDVRIDWVDVGDVLDQGMPREISSTVGDGVPLGSSTTTTSPTSPTGSLNIVAQPARGSLNWSVNAPGAITMRTYAKTDVLSDITPTGITAYFLSPPALTQGTTQTMLINFTDSAATPNTVSLPVNNNSGYYTVSYPLTGLLYEEAENGTRSSVSTMMIYNDRTASNGQAVSVTTGGNYIDFACGILDAGLYTPAVSLRPDPASSTPANDLDIQVLNTDTNTVLCDFTTTAVRQAGDAYYWVNGLQFTAPGGANITVRFTKALNDAAQYYVDQFRVQAALYTLTAGTITCSTSVVDPPLPVVGAAPTGNKQLIWSSRQLVFRGGGTLTGTANVVAGDAGIEPVLIVRAATPASWLTVSPATGNTPATFTFTADPTSLAPGIYSETVQVVDNAATPTYAADTISVVLIVPSTNFGSDAQIALWY